MNIQTVKQRYKQAEEILFNTNLCEFGDHKGKLVKISDAYAGVWLEHAYDPLVLATLYPEYKDVALSQARCFFEKQRPDGQFPALIRDPAHKRYIEQNIILCSYMHIQECVSFSNICYETYQLTKDKAFLQEAYDALCKWDAWLCSARMTRGEGLIETFAEWDTGHDNSLRFEGFPRSTADDYGRVCAPHEALPMLSPDMNAVFYGGRMGLAKMAKELGKTEESAAWEQKAAQVKQRMMELLYDEQDQFFYDVDKDGNKRKFKTILMANVFQEHLLTQDEFEPIYQRYFRNEKEFLTYIPFASTAQSDKHFIQNADGNSWNFYAQGLVALRAERWMPYYGKHEDYKALLTKWVEAYCQPEAQFGQEFHPVTGKPSVSSPNYSSALLFFIRAVRELGML